MDELRTQIDAIDADLLRLFEQRMDVSAQIGAYKKAHGLPVRDCGREAAKRQSAQTAVRAEYAPYAAELYDKLAQLSRRFQEENR